MSEQLTAHQHNIGYTEITQKLSIYNRFKTRAVVKSIRRIKVKSQETIKPNISNKTKNILGVDRVKQLFMQRRNVEVSLSYHIIVVTLEEHTSHC